MDEAGFWTLIAECRTEAPAGGDRLAEVLGMRLRATSPAEISSFGTHWNQAREQLYTWPVWAAADLLLDWVGDDSFRDFRAWVVTHGRETWAKVVEDPDNLADLVDDLSNAGVEDFDGLVDDAYEAAAGAPMPEAPRGESAMFEPRGERTDLGDQDAVRAKFPRLFAFRERVNAVPRYDLINDAPDDALLDPRCPRCGQALSGRAYQTSGPDADGIVQQPREFRVCTVCSGVCWRWRSEPGWTQIEVAGLDGRQQFYVGLLLGQGIQERSSEALVDRRDGQGLAGLRSVAGIRRAHPGTPSSDTHG